MSIDDMVEEWHSSEEDGRSLQEFLDMNDHEFRIWIMTAKPTQSYLDRHPDRV